MRKLIHRLRMQVWVLFLPILLAVVVLVIARPAAAFMPIEIKELVIKALPQEVDADGDGQTEPFSAYVEVYEGSSARGSVSVGAHNLVLKRGITACVGGVETAILDGTLYETIGGTQVEIGDVVLQVAPANGNGGGSGGGGGDIDLGFDIINNAVHLRFIALGTLAFTNPPCAA